MTSQYGGALFIIIYLLFIIFFSIPLFTAETLIGRRAQTNACEAFNKLSHGKMRWAGSFGMIGCFLVTSYYCVVGGWCINYLFRSVANLLGRGGLSGIESLQTTFVTVSGSLPQWSESVQSVLFTLVFALTCGAIVIIGVKKGIETSCKWIMPILFLLIIFMAIRVMFLPGAMEGMAFLFRPDFSCINGKVVMAAMGQAFFSLSLGSMAVITYGSYMRRDDSIGQISTFTAFSDTIFAVIASVMIIPAVFAMGLEVSQGAGVSFISMPFVFSNIPGGPVLLILFFIGLLFASVSSEISMLESNVAYVMEKLKMSRKGATILVTLTASVFAVLCALSFGPLSHIKILDRNIFDLFDAATANIFFPVTGVLGTILIGWVMKKEHVVAELSRTSSPRPHKTTIKAFYVITKYIIPIMVTAIIINGLISQ